MLKPLVKTALVCLGIDPAALRRVFRSTKLVRFFANNRTSRFINDAAARKEFSLKTVRHFNPGLEKNKAPGVTRIATIWEGSGRFTWLNHANHNLGIELIHIPRAVVNPGWLYHLRGYLDSSKNERSLGEYALDHYLDARYTSCRTAFRSYCAHAVETIQNEFSIDALIMPKLNDDWTIDFINAIKSLGIPILVDDREGVITPKRLKVLPSRLQTVPQLDFDFLCVHNDIHRELFTRGGMDPKKIVVNGAPQSDYWQRPDLWQGRTQIHPALRDDRFLILFFSFGPRTYLNFYYGEDERTWMGLCEDFHEVLLKLLHTHGDRVQIVNKSGGKPLRDQFPGYHDFARRAAPYINQNNYIELDGTYSAFDLINCADAVLGFQTSGMIEAMFTDVPILYGAWGTFFDEIKDTLLPLHKCGGVIHATSSDELYQSLERLISSPGSNPLNDEQKAERKTMREKYFSRPDGNVSRRLLNHAKTLVHGYDEARDA